MSAPDPSAWRARPVLAGAVRVAALAVPLLTCVGSVLLVAHLLPADVVWTLPGLGLLLAVSVLASTLVERAARRVLPLSVLLQLTMVFPDRAPSRLRLVRDAARSRPPQQLLWAGAAPTPVSVEDVVVHLVRALTDHDRHTRGHSERVRVLTEMLAVDVGLDEPARERLRWVALLHDVGKLSVSPRVLNKPARLDSREFATIKEHPAHGAELAAPLMPWLGEWGTGILDHHERWDGTGYPNGKSGAEISTAGRIISVVDAFETMTGARPYKKALATRAARAELARCAGSHFDPTYVRAFLSLSLPRVLWAMGPVAFLVQLPFLRLLADAGARTSGVAPQTAAAVGAAGAAALFTTAGTPGALVQLPPAEAQAPAVAAPEAARPVAVPAQERPEHVERRARTLSVRTPPLGSAPAVDASPPVAAAPAPPAAAPPAAAPPAAAPPAAAPPAATEPVPLAAAAQPSRPAPRRTAPQPPPAGVTAVAGDLVAPQVELPLRAVLAAAPPAQTADRSATFALGSDGPYECLVTRSGQVSEQAGLRPCTGSVTYEGLQPGRYRFQVRPVGGTEWTVHEWTVIPSGS